MTLSNRIAVMDSGRFHQVGTPKEVYEFPTSRFVAEFIGTINTFKGRVAAIDGDRITVSCDAAGANLEAIGKHPLNVGECVEIAVRPEKIFVTKEEPPDEGGVRLQGIVDDLGYLGSRSLYRVKLPSGKVVQVSSQNRRRSVTRFLEWQDRVWITWQPQSAVVLVD